MKITKVLMGMVLLAAACQPPMDNSANELFEKNSKAVTSYIDGYVNENLDHAAFYSPDIIFQSTSVGGQDSITLKQMIGYDQQNWAMFDFELVTDPVVLLPGVNAETKKMDGSVRYYGTWKATMAATDSTDEKSVEVQIYESFDFDENGKVINHVNYGDWGGMWNAMSK